MKPFLSVILLALVVLLTLGCEQSPTPEPQVVIVTATPDPAVTPEERVIVVTATPQPTSRTVPTPEATPTPEQEGLIILRPTPTRTPTSTIGPTGTPVPTPRQVSGSEDICYRSPAVQRILMAYLNINLCRLVTPGELFRLDGELRIDEKTTLYPADLEGLFNLKELRLREPNLQYQRFLQTPSLETLYLQYPVNYRHLELGHLTKLQSLAIETANAECTLLRTGFLRQLIGGLENLREVSIRGQLQMPSSAQDHELVQRQIQSEVLRSSSSPLERDNVRVSMNLYDPEDYPDQIPPCSEGH